MTLDLGPPPAGSERGDPRPSREAPAPADAGVLGVRILLASLAVLFAASIAGYLVVRLKAEAWPPPGMPRLPSGLGFATLVIFFCSVSIQIALVSIRRGQLSETKVWLALTFFLALVFLGVQWVNWSALISRAVTVKSNLYAFTFYMLTGLHAAHVIGGLIPLGIVLARALRGGYGSGHHPGVRYMAMYWHFLGVVWLVLYGILGVFA